MTTDREQQVAKIITAGQAEDLRNATRAQAIWEAGDPINEEDE